MLDFPIDRIDLNLEIFNTADDVLSRAFTIGDPLIALEYVAGLQKEELAKGLAIAKIMYKLKEGWDIFKTAGIDDSFEALTQSRNGYKPSTIDKYTRMWESIFENEFIDPEIKEKLAGRPIKDLLLLTAAAREMQLSKEDWRDVVVAEDTAKVRSIIHKVRGDQTSSKNAITFQLYRNDTTQYPRDTLIMSKGDKRMVVGKLYLSLNDEDAQKAIARIINAVNILEI